MTTIRLDNRQYDDEAERYEVGVEIWDQFCVDMQRDPAMARARLVASIQIALRESLNYGTREGYRAKKQSVFAVKGNDH